MIRMMLGPAASLSAPGLGERLADSHFYSGPKPHKKTKEDARRASPVVPEQQPRPENEDKRYKVPAF